MKCIILAAGYATRLYPLTENFPKPLLEVGGRPILDHLISDIEATGMVDGYIVISNHKFAGHFQDWAALRPQWDITVIDDGTSTNETRLGAVVDIRFALEEMERNGSPVKDALVIAGDNLLSFSLSCFIDYALAKGTPCIMRYAEPSEERLHKCGVVEVDADDRILSMEEKPAHPRSNWCCPPFYYYTQEAVGLVAEGIREGCGTDAPGSFIAWLAQRMDVHAMEMPGRRYDIGNLESYNQIRLIYENFGNLSDGEATREGHLQRDEGPLKC